MSIHELLKQKFTSGNDVPVSSVRITREEYEAAVKDAVPDGFVLVPSSEFSELMFWLDRCDEKGHLENCPDLVDPLNAFNKKMLAASQPEVK